MTPDGSHISGMKPILTSVLFATFLALPAMAQDRPTAPETPQTEEPGLIGEGLRLLFEGLLKEMEPALDEMGRAMKDLEPMARDLAALLGDVRNYDPPERLPNGDIIIRRKPDAPPPPPAPGETDAAPPQIDL